MKRHPEALMAAKVGCYRLQPGVTWDDIARIRAKYSIQPRAFPIAIVQGVAAGWAVPLYDPTTPARIADLLTVAGFQRRQLGVNVTHERNRAGLMADSLFLIMRARRLRITGFEHERGQAADHPRMTELMRRIIDRETGRAA